MEGGGKVQGKKGKPHPHDPCPFHHGNKWLDCYDNPDGRQFHSRDSYGVGGFNNGGHCGCRNQGPGGCWDNQYNNNNYHNQHHGGHGNHGRQGNCNHDGNNNHHNNKENKSNCGRQNNPPNNNSYQYQYRNEIQAMNPAHSVSCQLEGGQQHMEFHHFDFIDRENGFGPVGMNRNNESLLGCY